MGLREGGAGGVKWISIASIMELEREEKRRENRKKRRGKERRAVATTINSGT